MDHIVDRIGEGGDFCVVCQGHGADFALTMTDRAVVEHHGSDVFVEGDFRDGRGETKEEC